MNGELPSGPGRLATALPKYPYPGLRPFEAAEWTIFFGRERMFDDVIDRLAAHRIVLIHGSSGSGKSSLVRAGVLPKLERQHRRAGAPWRTCTMRPSGGPLWNLATELARLDGAGDDADRVGEIAGRFNRRSATLSEVAASLKGLDGQRLCILVDQFEELFRFEKDTSREEAELFIELLMRSDVASSQGDGSADAAPIAQAANVHVVVTMRSEFLGDCARFHGFAEAINRTQYLVPRMDRDALLRAIRRPAQLYGGEVTLDLAERLMADAAGREDELPLIQHGLMLMWHEAIAKVQPGARIALDAAPLEAAGGLARMLSSHADAALALATPDPERRQAAEHLFRALTDMNADGNAIRRPRKFRDLLAETATDAETLRGIIEALRRDGVSFLTPYPPQPIADETSIDIGHEALIRCWDRLADTQDGWLKREFDEGLIWRSLLVEATSFESDKRRILSPATTEERGDWWEKRKLNESWAERYGGNFKLVRELIDASRRAAVRERFRSKLAQSAIYCLLLAVIGGLIWINQAALQAQWRLYTVTRPYKAHQVEPYVLSEDAERTDKPGDVFRECASESGEDNCPQMVVVPAGSFTMGSNPTSEGLDHSEEPQHPVTIAAQFAVSKYELTFAEWDVCVKYGDCPPAVFPVEWRGERSRYPVVNVSWDDAQHYAAWLSRMTGKPYRLLNEAEYEYVARAGSQTIYPWGDEQKLDGNAMADCSECGSKWDKTQAAPVGSFPANKFGVYDMVGNVWEWVKDCWHENYSGAPADGSAWTAGGDCDHRVSRGGSFLSPAKYVHSTSRIGLPRTVRDHMFGFRVARTLAKPY